MNKEFTVYTYRYMWLSNDSENMRVLVVSGTPEEHAQLIEQFKNDESVVKACRVYMGEINIRELEHYQDLKGDEKDEK